MAERHEGKPSGGWLPGCQLLFVLAVLGTVLLWYWAMGKLVERMIGCPH